MQQVGPWNWVGQCGCILFAALVHLQVAVSSHTGMPEEGLCGTENRTLDYCNARLWPLVLHFIIVLDEMFVWGLQCAAIARQLANMCVCGTRNMERLCGRGA